MSLLFEKLFKLLKVYFMIVGLLVTAFFVLLGYLISNSITKIKMPLQVEEPMENSHLISLNWTQLSLLNSESENAGLDIIVNEILAEHNNLYIPWFEARLNEMAKDDRVKGLFIEMEVINGSLSQLDELRRALLKFKQESNKPIYFWMPFAETKSYYLATVGNEIIMPPSGQMMLLGPVVSQVYFGEALKKLGVDLEVIKSGTYKAGFEPFVKNEPSDYSKQAYESLEKSLRDDLLKDMAKSYTHLSESELRAAFKHSLFNADQGLKNKLVTKLSYKNTSKDDLEKQHNATFYSFSDYVLENNLHDYETYSAYDKNPGVALIEAVGEFKLFESSGTNITPKSMIKELTWAREAEEVKAVVLRISSPGGDAISADLIWDEVRKLAEAKPLVVSMGSVAASGGYYIAAPAKKIFALPTTITGSIGTLSMIGNLKNFKDKYGINFYVHTESDRAKLINMGMDASEEDKKILHDSASWTYDHFIKKVSQGRKLTENYVRTIAEGRPWSGSQAKEIKLVDELGGLREALIEAKILGGFDKEAKVPVHRWLPKIRSFQDCFRNKDTLKRCFSSGSALFKEKMGFSLKKQLEDLDLNALQLEIEKKLRSQM